jgi:hypothetical protein
MRFAATGARAVPTDRDMRNRKILFGIALSLVAGACGGGSDISSDEEARRAYLGLDQSIETSLNLGFDGFNAASSANIDPQLATGIATGTLTITGQVDQGSSDNKGMRLHVGMVDYSDGVFTVVVVHEDQSTEEVEVDLTYDTSDVIDQQPYLQLSLRNIPTGTFEGSLTGTYFLAGDIDGDCTLSLTMAGQIMDGGAGLVVRVPGSTTVTGTATSGDGTYAVNVTL